MLIRKSSFEQFASLNQQVSMPSLLEEIQAILQQEEFQRLDQRRRHLTRKTVYQTWV